jgi:hypothetical protein
LTDAGNAAQIDPDTGRGTPPMTQTHGRCLCGAVRFTFDPEGVVDASHCHCDSCRRTCSAPMTTTLSVRDTAWRWIGEVPKDYRSSPGVVRMFCGTCGSPVAYRTDAFPGETGFYAASLEDPADFTPEGHSFWSERLPWLHVTDDLPKYDGMTAD